MPRPVRFILYALLIASNLALSYGLALVGEPSSVWLWSHVSGLL